MKNKKDSLTKVIFLSWLTTIIALSIIFVFFVIYYKYNDFEGTSISLRKAHIEGYDRSLKSNVENNLKLLDYLKSKVSPDPISKDSNIDKITQDVIKELNKTPSIGISESSTYIISPDGKILYHSTNKKLSGKTVEFTNEKGKDITGMVIRRSRNLKGDSFAYFKKHSNFTTNERIFGFAKIDNDLGVIVFSEIPFSELETSISMNLKRLKINLYTEMGFASFIFILIIGVTVFYIYRLSKTIRSELMSILTFINNTNDRKVYNSFAPEKFHFREFEKIGQCSLLLVKQVNKLIKRISAEAIESETASQSKSSLFAGFSHDFLVELNTIMGMSQFLLKSDLPKEEKDKVNKIFHSSSNITSMLRNLETTSLFGDSQEEFKKENIDIKQIFGEAIQFIEHQANAQEIEFNYEIDEAIPENCIADPVPIRQLIINILRNVISFNEKGKVDLKLNAEKEDKELKLFFEAENYGEGFMGTELNEIQSFPNARPKYSMLSLRVAVCNYIASKLDAEFELTSVKGEGTKYKITLPLPISDKKEPEKKQNVAEQIEKLSADDSEKKVLVVEDEPANRELLSDLLKSSGYKVLTAANGKEAIGIFEKESINLILMDCQMPVLNGFKATRKIREMEKGQDVKIIAITGCTSPADKKECFDAGMDEFIAKPYDIPELLELIKKSVG